MFYYKTFQSKTIFERQTELSKCLSGEDTITSIPGSLSFVSLEKFTYPLERSLQNFDIFTASLYVIQCQPNLKMKAIRKQSGVELFNHKQTWKGLK